MGQASASASASSSAATNAPNSGNITQGGNSYSWIAWAVGGIVVLFGLAVWAKKRSKD